MYALWQLQPSELRHANVHPVKVMKFALAKMAQVEKKQNATVVLRDELMTLKNSGKECFDAVNKLNESLSKQSKDAIIGLNAAAQKILAEMSADD